MKVKILKAFPYGADGINAVALAPGGDPVEIRDEFVPGLVQEGFVERVADVDPAIVEAERLAAIARAKETAAALLPQVDALEWNEFRRQAVEILGDGAPKSKEDIIAALTALTAG